MAKSRGRVYICIIYIANFWDGGTSCDSTKVKQECHLQLLVEILLQKNVLQFLQHKRVSL